MTPATSVLMSVSIAGLSRSGTSHAVHILGVFNTECHPFKAPGARNYTVGTYKPSQKPFAVTTGDVPTISPQSSLKNLKLPTLNDILNIF